MTTRRVENSVSGEFLEADVVGVAKEDNEAVILQLEDSAVSQDSHELEVHKVPFEDKTLIRRERIILPVTKSECGNYFTVEAEDLDMPLSEASLEELKDAFDSVLRIMWRRYAMGDPQKMTRGALEFREQLIATYRLV